MHDPDIRFALLCSIVGAMVIAGGVLITWHMRRAYWKKLRQAGDQRAKQRELMRGRKSR